MSRHEVRIIGEAASPGDIDGRALTRTLDALVDGAAKVVRLVGEGRSTARATVPEWVLRSSAFRFRPVASAVERTFSFAVEDEPLTARDARFEQLELLRNAQRQASGISLLEDALEAALAGAGDSALLDDGMLSSFEELGRVFQSGVERIEVVNGRTVTFSPEGLRAIERMKRETPRANHVRLVGRLEVLRHSRRSFELILTDGAAVTGIAEGLDDAVLVKLWGSDVVVEGTAHFTPSGRLRRIDATLLEPATETDRALFVERPKPLFGSPARTPAPPVGRPGATWIDALWGRWPGDESPEELAQLLRGTT